MFVESMSKSGIAILRKMSVWRVRFFAMILFVVFGAMAGGCGWLAYWMAGLDDEGMRGLIVALPAMFLAMGSIGFGFVAFGMSIGLVCAKAEVTAMEKSDAGD